MKKIIIIGGGVSGLIANYYLKDKGEITLLESRNNIDFYKDFTFYIHQFIDDNITKKKVKIKTEIIDKTDNFIEDYSKKVYGEIVPNISIANCEGEKDAWILNYEDIAYAGRRIAKLNEKVIDINPDKHIVATQNVDYEYDIVINTAYLPAILHLITGEDIRPKFIPIGLRTESTEQSFNEGLTIVKYYPSDKYDYYRSFDDGKFKYLEYAMNEKEAGFYNKVKEWDRVIYPGKIFVNEELMNKGKEMEKYKIYNVGRYSEWIPKRMFYEVALKMKEFADKI